MTPVRETRYSTPGPGNTLINPAIPMENRKEYYYALKEKILAAKLPLKLFGAIGKHPWKNPMMQFLTFASIVRIPNGSILKFEVPSEQEIILKEFIISHIPKELRGSFFLDR